MHPPHLPRLPSLHLPSLHNLHHRIPLFRIFYSTTLLLASALLAALLLISPGDNIYQAFRQDQLYHVLVVAGTYILTFAIAVVVYAGRLFGTRSALAGVGKSICVGGEGGGEGRMRIGGRRVGRGVEGVVRGGWGRSAVVAWGGRPRELRGGEGVVLGGFVEGEEVEVPVLKRRRKMKRREVERGIGTDRALGDTTSFAEGAVGEKKKKEGEEEVESDLEPVWGEIRHPGWSWGSKFDIKGVQFEAVVVELGGLIEAKAVSLAPLVGGGDDDDEEDVNEKKEDDGDGERTTTTVPDPLVVNLLQRSVSMGLRDYIAHLITLGMIHPPTIGEEFLHRYERARFSGEAVEEDEFETLMKIFAEILRGMKPVETDVVEGLRERAEAELEAAEDELDAVWDGEGDDDSNEVFANNDIADDVQSLISNATVNRTPQPPIIPSTSASSFSTSAAASLSDSTDSPQGTAHTTSPSHPRSRPRNHRYTSAKSTASAAVTKDTSSSLRKMRSDITSTTRRSTRSVAARSEAGSVIRLADESGGPLDLPYLFVGDGGGGAGGT